MQRPLAAESGRAPRVCIVTPGQIGSNPRVVKEAQALHESGCDVRVIATQTLDLVEPRDLAIMGRISWRVQRIDLRSRLRWRLLRAAQLAARRTRAAGLGGSADAAFSAFTRPLRRAALATPADLYIAHYPAALPAAAAAARKFGARYAYDAEDFHPGDWPEDPAWDGERRLAREIEGGYLPGCAYVTAASPGIADAYAEAYGIERPRVVLNTFPLAQACAQPTLAGTARPGPSLYWFSQTIGPHRGLESAVRAIGLARTRPHLYLRGTPAVGYAERLLDLARAASAGGRVHLLPPDDPDRMERLAAAYDAGLVAETGHTASRRLCLTNKLFSFLLAGIPPLMSDTPAHCSFAAEAGLADLLYPRDDPAALAALLDGLLGDPARLAAARIRAWKLGQERYNWETDRGGLLEAVGRATLRVNVEGELEANAERPTRESRHQRRRTGALDRLRRLRDGSRTLQAVHAVLREPYYAALCLLYPRGVTVDLQQHAVKLHPRLLGIRPCGYEGTLSAAMDKRIAPGMTIVDVGAHVGLHSLRFSRMVGQNGHVIAVEPSPANASLLRTHLAWNGCKNVTLIEAAVGEDTGEMDFGFRPDPTDPGGFANSMAYDIGGSKARVKVTTIDEICRGLTPGIVKIDIEGAELLAIRGARGLLSRCAPLLVVAVHPDPMRALGTAPSGLVEFLHGFGYVGRRLDGSRVKEPVFEEIVFEKQGNGAMLHA